MIWLTALNPSRAHYTMMLYNSWDYWELVQVRLFTAAHVYLILSLKKNIWLLSSAAPLRQPLVSVHLSVEWKLTLGDLNCTRDIVGNPSQWAINWVFFVKVGLSFSSAAVENSGYFTSSKLVQIVGGKLWHQRISCCKASFVVRKATKSTLSLLHDPYFLLVCYPGLLNAILFWLELGFQ